MKAEELKYYTIEEAAEIAGCAIPTLRKDIRKGNISYRQRARGTEITIDHADLVDYINWKRGTRVEATRKPAKHKRRLAVVS